MLRFLRAPAADLPPASPERVARWVLVALVIFVAYGCLYPFILAGRVKPILAWPAVPALGDVIANLAIYAVLGFVAYGAMLPRRGAWPRLLAVLALCVPLSVAIEIAQAFIAGRHSSALDVVANAAGAAAGALGARIFRDAGFRQDLAPGTGVGGAMLLLGLWLGCRLAPFVAAIDLQQVNRALALLGGSWQPHPWPILHLAALWLAVFHIVAVLSPRRNPVMAGIAVALALTLLRVTLRGHLISPLEIYAIGLAALVYGLGIRQPWVIAAALAIAIVHEALQPFVFGPSRPLNLMPFRAFIQGNIEIALQRVLFRSFTYGALAWLLLHAGLRVSVAIAGGTLAILALELAQTRIPGRYGDITDPILFLGLALAIRQLDRLDLRRPDARNALGAAAPGGVQSTGKAEDS